MADNKIDRVEIVWALSAEGERERERDPHGIRVPVSHVCTLTTVENTFL